MSLALALPVDRIVETIPFFDAFPKKEENYAYIVSYAMDFDLEIAEALLKQMEKELPESEELPDLREELKLYKEEE